MAELKIDITKVVEAAIKDMKQEGYTVQKWIPCSERLPEDGDVVIIAHVAGIVHIAYKDGTYWIDYHDEDCYVAENVTHWMPLPDLPEGGADNG